MFKLRTNQSGFSLLEAMLITIILVILSATGYYVYHANKKTDDTLSSASSIAQSSPSEVTKKKSTHPSPAAPAIKTPQQDGTVSKTTYSKAPADLQAVIVQQLAPGCLKNGQPATLDGQFDDLSLTYDTAGFALVPIGCDGGAVHLLVKSSGSWQDIEHTQFAFDCNTLKQNHVPPQLLAVAFPDHAQCVDPSTPNGTPLTTYAG